MQSDIQVFVRWKEQAIFAGEDVECIITFKNISTSHLNTEINPPQSHSRRGSRPVNGIVNGTNYLPAKSLNPFSSNNRRPPPPSPLHRQAHRASASISSPLATSHSFPPNFPHRSNPSSGHKHKRSVSIISGDPEISAERPLPSPSPSAKFGRTHARSASFQIFPKRTESNGERYSVGEF